MDSRRRDDRTVCRIAQGIAQRRHLSRKLDIKRNDIERATRLDAPEQFLNRDFQSGRALAEQYGDFEQSDGAQRKLVAVPSRGAQHTGLFPREPSRSSEPTDQHVGIQQQPGRQRDLLFTTENFPQIRGIGSQPFRRDAHFASPHPLRGL